jgi:hypothetical protein
VAFLVATALALPVVLVPTGAVAATDYLLMSRSALLARPVSGAAWTILHDIAIQSLGTPNLCDQDDDHHLRTLVAALVYARTGATNYGTKARAGVMATIGTQHVGCSGRTRGKAKVYLDGAYVATVDMYRSSYTARRVLFARNLADGSHTLPIQALGMSGHPTVAIDGMYLLNPG